MHPFKKMIYMSRNVSSGTPTPSPPSVVLMIDDSYGCYGEVNVKVRTTIPVKINITGTFGTGGSYADTSYLTGVNQKYANVVNEEISTMTIYNYGINGSLSGGTSNTSTILFTVNDFTTGDIISSYLFTRIHSSTPC